MSREWPGGLIRPTPVTPTGPYQNSVASGVWTLDQMNYWLKQNLWPIAGNVAPRGLFGGGYYDAPLTYYNVIDYINIASTGNATDFGDLTRTTSSYMASFSSSTRGGWANGANGQSNLTGVNIIDYVTIMTTGNAIDFGDTTVQSTYCAGSSNSTRGLIAIGFTVSPVANSNIIEYVTIASTGNSLDFGDLTLARRGATSCSSTTRALFAGGFVSTYDNTIDYVTIATTGNATDFGDLTSAAAFFASCSSNTRGVMGGGPVIGSTLNYVTIATTGNATFFGNLRTSNDYANTGTSSPTRGVFANQGAVNNIEYITIATTGNSQVFGDLSVRRYASAACSSAHGGL